MAERRALGKTDIKITPIGLGCWQFSKRKNMAGQVWPDLEQQTMDQIVAATLEGGVNWFDTAEVYGNGASEEALATALKNLGKRPGDAVVATKWMPLARTPGSILSTFKDREKALGEYPIDLHQVHFPLGTLGSDEAKMEAMAELHQQGKIKAVGISNYGASGMRRCIRALAKHGIPLASNQVQYSLLDRSIEATGTLQAAKDLGVTIIAYSPLAQGLLTGKFHAQPSLIRKLPLQRRLRTKFWISNLRTSRPVIQAVEEIAQSRNVTPSQVALRWIIQFSGETVVAIPGATKVEQARQNTGALHFSLSDEEMDRLDKVSRPFRKAIVLP